MPDLGLSLDLYITANSPGEIAGWVVPLVREVRARIWRCRITLVIVPCQYASGAELAFGRTSGVDRCVRIGDIGTLIAGDAQNTPVPPKMILHLGGDFLFSIYLSKRLSCGVWAYAARPRWSRFVERFFIPDQTAERRFALDNLPAEKYERVGHLALDSVVLKESEEETREVLGFAPQEPIISFLTGSRPIEYRDGLSYFARIAAQITEQLPDHRVVFPLAPTVDEEQLCDGLRNGGFEWRGATRVHAIRLAEDRWASVVRDRTLEAINCSKLVIAVPGTNNLQAAALYIPLIMVLPLDRADEYPLDGLPGILPLWFPGVRKLKKSFILRLNKRTKFVSLPNRMAGKCIAPELRGIFPPEDVVREALALLKSPERLQEISRGFWELTHERGAAAKMAERIAEWAKSPDRRTKG